MPPVRNQGGTESKSEEDIVDPNAPTLDPNAPVVTGGGDVPDPAATPTDTLPPVDAPVEEEDDSVKLRIVNTFGSGDTFNYTDGEGNTYTIGTAGTPVPPALVDIIVNTARENSVQIEQED